MNTHKEEAFCDLLIIGTGMAGMAAALFAARNRIDTVQVGQMGEINFASGLLDLLGVHPVSEGRVLDDPWQGIVQLCQDEPLHPYARLSAQNIRTAFETVTDFLDEHNYPHLFLPNRNQQVITPAGTIKPTYAVPLTMRHGPPTLAERRPCLLVDFEGLKGFSVRQIAGSLIDRWPGLRTAHIRFPDMTGELYTERMARALDMAQTRKKLIAAIQPHLRKVEAVGLPAVLGVYRTQQTMEILEQGLGVPVFEIPTMLPGVTGLRLRELFEQHLPPMGIRPFYQQRIHTARRLPDGRWQLDLEGAGSENHIIAKSAVLCSGRFFGKGLHADRKGIRESLFNLPVVQPQSRMDWHHKELLHPSGHPINRAGVAVDDCFRPADSSGQALYDNLFAAGTILAHQDWIRQKCGSGLAIATAFGAITACNDYLNPV